jgi:hypothetical protein
MQATDTISGDLTMREVLEISPGAQRALFRRYHIGGCASCGFRPDETLAEVCARNENLPVAEVVDYLLTSQEEDRRIQITPAELSAALQDGAAKIVDVRTREARALRGGIDAWSQEIDPSIPRYHLE